jgi:hypothetical protein
MSREFPKDPDNAGWVLGWGVVRNSPWSFLGIYPSEEEAESVAADAGEGYLVRHGSHRPGTDDFVWTS